MLLMFLDNTPRICQLFNPVLLEEGTPEAWSRNLAVLFFKNGNKTILKNYRPISILSHVFKSPSNRLARRLNEFQLTEDQPL